MLYSLYVHHTEGCVTQVGRRGTVRSSLARAEDANAARRNGVFTNLISLEETQMAQVVYRGVAYDTETAKATVTKKVTETYRGIQHTETVTVEVAK